MAAYQDVSAELKKLILENLKPGEPLPSERDLAEFLHTSRDTIRRIFQGFREEGLIRQQQGQGTFVAEPRITMDISVLHSFTTGTLLSGKQPASDVLVTEIIKTTPRLSESLNLNTHDEVIHVVRRRLANGLVVALEDSYFPKIYVPTLLNWDLGQHSIYDLMGREFNARPIRASQTLDAVAAGQMESSILEVRLRAPLIRITRQAYDDRNRLVEFARDLFRPDRIQFVADSHDE